MIITANHANMELPCSLGCTKPFTVLRNLLNCFPSANYICTMLHIQSEYCFYMFFCNALHMLAMLMIIINVRLSSAHHQHDQSPAIVYLARLILVLYHVLYGYLLELCWKCWVLWFNCHSTSMPLQHVTANCYATAHVAALAQLS